MVSPKVAGLSLHDMTIAAKTKASGVGGEREMPLASVTLTLGNTTLVGHTVAIADTQTGDGILGNDVLRHFSRVTIDYKRGVLVLED